MRFCAGHRKSPCATERFWAKVDKSGPRGCWLWTGGHTGAGYGAFSLTHDKTILAHRYSWILANGEIPDGLEVLHQCDNPPCINPMHLFLGTQSENMTDMASKGRQPGKKLTIDQIRAIRLLRSQGAILKRIAKQFGVSIATVSKIAKLEIWRAID